MPNLQQCLQTTNANYINIDKNRQAYTNHFNKLRDTIYSTLKKEQPLEKWLCGHKLGGSYADHVKITNPDEFDLVIHLKFPENDRIIVKKDPKKPGNVTLDMTALLKAIENQAGNEVTLTNLRKLVNPKNLLLEDKLQNMLNGAVTRALNKMGHQIEVDGKISKVVYKRCGPAHTMSINDKNMQYSVDFVPAIRLSASQNILDGAQLKYFKNIPFWDAIPKPLKPFEWNNVSFRASYYDAENLMLKDKHRLKDVIKFMKKFRDSKQNMNNLKSYYIKTLLLWQVVRKDPSYWNKQLKDILIDMFRELKLCVATCGRYGKLPFFWDPKLDLFAQFTVHQRNDMFNCVAAQLHTLEIGDGIFTDKINTNVKCSFTRRIERDFEIIPRNGEQEISNPSSDFKNPNTTGEQVKPNPAPADNNANYIKCVIS